VRMPQFRLQKPLKTILTIRKVLHVLLRSETGKLFACFFMV
jgi:hypothetical protein